MVEQREGDPGGRGAMTATRTKVRASTPTAMADNVFLARRCQRG